MEKKTIREMYAQILSNYNLTAEEVNFLNGRIAQLDKKNTKTGPSETQVENAKLANEIYDYVAGNTSATTIAQVRKHFDLSPQKVTPIMTSLVNDGRLVKTVEKRVSYFTIA